ncbi:MAG TPA: DUF3047 domain-containing protein [Geobacteraceae bacterium]|jgi:hypothetical protein|nr:DUF3047 domain-containing protein [Geobacteraceae bacterium]
MKTFVTALIILLAVAAACAAEVAVGRFSAGDLSGWHDETFRGKAKTSYHLVKENGRTVLMAQSRRAASGLLKKVDLNPRNYPLLRWSWKVEHTLKGEDVTRKSGDDFAARVYVMFPRTFFWQMRALNYVWAARLPKNSAVPSPYTVNAVIIAAESGETAAGTWVREERNVYEDYRRAFGEEPPRVGAVAVMTDTDDTGDEAVAWYGDITMAER